MLILLMMCGLLLASFFGIQTGIENLFVKESDGAVMSV